MNQTTEHILHILAGFVIVAAPLLVAGIPVSWQAETVGGLTAFVLSLLKQWYTATS
jgi:hypothetical protein